jgi:hypothetical protein
MTAERWVPWAGTWVSFDGDEPEQVQELALDYGTIRLGSRWVAISMCRAANPRKGQP